MSFTWWGGGVCVCVGGGTGVFCVPISNLELCSGMQLRSSDTVGVSQVYF